VICIEVCVGSSCFLRGSSKVIAEFQRLIAEYRVNASVHLKGCFCLDHCTQGVSVKIDDTVYRETYPGDVQRLFEEHVLSRFEVTGAGSTEG
jgi:NADH:ubiquinone oxidoreductase subunit E